MKKKILFVLPGFNFGGTVFSTYNMISLLDSESYDIFVLAMTHQGPVKENYMKASINVLPENILLSCLAGKIKDETGLRKAAFYSIKAIRRILSILGLSLSLFIYNRVANRIQKLYSFDFVASCQELESTFFVSCFKNAKKIAWFRSEMNILKDEIGVKEFNFVKSNYLKFDKIVCVSKTTCDDFNMYVPGVSDKLIAIHNIQNLKEIELKANEQITDFPCGKFVIVTVGRMNPQKRFSFIPKIAKELKDKGCEFKWLLIGDGNVFGEYDKTLEAIKKYGVEDFVECIGSRLNPYPYIKNASLLVNTSYVEACPRVVAEAKILKTPVICADFSSAREFVTNGYDGFVSTIDGIAEPIFEMIENVESYNKIKSVCESYKFDNDVIYGQLREVFK